jgi:hypothetical protein
MPDNPGDCPIAKHSGTVYNQTKHQGNTIVNHSYNHA